MQNNKFYLKKFNMLYVKILIKEWLTNGNINEIVVPLKSNYTLYRNFMMTCSQDSIPQDSILSPILFRMSTEALKF